MGRAGGGGGGSHSSSSGHSFSHSSGGHHIGDSGSSGRAMGDSSFSSSSSYSGGSSSSFGDVGDMIGREIQRGIGREIGRSIGRRLTGVGIPRGGLGTPPPGYPPMMGSYGGGYYGESRRRRSSSGLMSLLIVFMIFAVIVVIGIIGGGSKGGKQVSTIQRTKIETHNAYMNDCVIDEIGWINNKAKLSASLKSFWDKTGVQPFIYMKAYDPSLTTDSAKETWTRQYYDNTFTTENVFLYVYFCEPNESDVGYMTYCSGYETGQVMDAEAVDIFWGYLDSFWYSYDEDDTDGMFEAVFTKTGDTIMKVSTTGKDVAKYILIAVIVIGGCIGVVVVMKVKRKNERERAEETERMLSRPLDTFGDNSADELTRRYDR